MEPGHGDREEVRRELGDRLLRSLPQWSPVTETGKSRRISQPIAAQAEPPQWSPVTETGKSPEAFELVAHDCAAMEPGHGDREESSPWKGPLTCDDTASRERSPPRP